MSPTTVTVYQDIVEAKATLSCGHVVDVMPTAGSSPILASSIQCPECSALALAAVPSVPPPGPLPTPHAAAVRRREQLAPAQP